MPRHPRNPEKPRDAQVGFLMRAYRESFPTEDGRYGISQNELLRLMAGVDPYYDMRSSHGTVSRWESGYTQPTGERLKVFGRALNLSEEEIEGLILLAGLDPGYQERRTLTCTRCGGETETTHTEKTLRKSGTETATIAATRERRCLECGHTEESCERWADEPEEIAQRRMQRVLRDIEGANDRIRRSLTEAETIQHPQPPEKEPRENQLPSGQPGGAGTGGIEWSQHRRASAGGHGRPKHSQPRRNPVRWRMK